MRKALRFVVVTALALAATLTAVGAADAATMYHPNWTKLANCESSGRWHINTGNGYYGGVQFSSSTWRAYGGRSYARQAHLASQSEQIAVARRVLASQGPYAWPACSRRTGWQYG